MTVTYVLTTTIGKIRLEINDTNTTTPKLTDEEIQYAIDQTSSFGAAVVKAIELLMAKVTDPTFTADWLTVNNDVAYKNLSNMRLVMCQQFGISSLTTTSVHTYRADSWASDSPDFTEIQTELDDDA